MMKMETINWLLAFVIVVLAYYSIRGGKLGFIRTVFSMFSILIALIAASFFSPYVSESIQKNETIVAAIEKVMTGDGTKNKGREELEGDEAKNKAAEKIESDNRKSKAAEEIEGNKRKDKAVEEIEGKDLDKQKKRTEKEQENQKDTGDKKKQQETDMDWQQFISEWIGNESNRISDIEDQTKQLITDNIIVFFINIISFVCAFIIIRIILAILCGTLDLVSKLPVLNGLNKASGFFAGFLHGLLNLWIGCIILTIFSQTEIGKILFQYINESPFLTAVYSQNILLKIFF